MSLIHHWPLNAGTGNIVVDTVGGPTYDFTPIAGDVVNWATGKVFDTQRNFMTVGWSRFPRYDGFLYNGNGLASDLDDFSICFVGRFLAGWIRDGAFLRITREFRTWGYNMDLVNSNRMIAFESEIDWGNFMVFIITGRGARYYDCYVSDNIGTPLHSHDSGYTGGFRLSASEMRLNSYSDTAYPGSLELADMRIYDHALSEAERRSYLDEFYTTLPTTFNFQRTDNDDFGGLVRWDEDDGSTGSEVTIQNFQGSNVVRHLGDGGTCQIALACEIRRNMGEIHIEMDQYIPANIDCNHDIGGGWHIFGLYNVPNGGDVIMLRGQHFFTGDPVRLYQVSVENSGGRTNYALTPDTITLDEWHNYRMKVDVVNGTLDFWYDGVSYLSLTGLTLDFEMKQVYYGLNLGVHPQNTGNYFYTRNHYVGEVQKAGPTGGGGSSRQFKRNALQIIYDEERN